MAKNVRDMKGGRLGAAKKSKRLLPKNQPNDNGKPEDKTISVNLANAPLFTVKFLEAILIELKALNKYFEEAKTNG